VAKVRKALSTLPWVEIDQMRASTSKQTVTIPFEDKAKWDEQAVREAIEKNTGFQVGKVLSGPRASRDEGRP
jgi:hypothetical protein